MEVLKVLKVVIILASIFVDGANCIYLNRYKRFSEELIRERNCIRICYQKQLQTLSKAFPNISLITTPNDNLTSLAYEVLEMCSICGNSSLVHDLLRVSKDLLDSIESTYLETLELNHCMRSKLLETNEIKNSHLYMVMLELTQYSKIPEAEVCSYLRLMEREISYKMLEACDDTNSAMLKAALIEIRYDIAVEYDLPYKSIYECYP